MFLNRSSSYWLLAVGITSGIALVAALIAQHAFGLAPCSWCVLQRFVLIELMVVGILGGGLFKYYNPLKLLTSLIVLISSSVGFIFAHLQAEVVNEQLSCDMTFADRALSSMPFGEHLPSVFGVYASCLESNVSLMGIGVAAWAGMFFAAMFILGIAALIAVIKGFPSSISLDN